MHAIMLCTITIINHDSWQLFLRVPQFIYDMLLPQLLGQQTISTCVKIECSMFKIIEFGLTYL